MSARCFQRLSRSIERGSRSENITTVELLADIRNAPIVLMGEWSDDRHCTIFEIDANSNPNDVLDAVVKMRKLKSSAGYVLIVESEYGEIVISPHDNIMDALSRVEKKMMKGVDNPDFSGIKTIGPEAVI